MVDFVVAGIPAGVVVVALVEAIKRLFKLDGDVAIAIALLTGIAVGISAHLASISPGFGEWWQVVIGGLLLGLSACGLFDLGQALKSRVQQ